MGHQVTGKAYVVRKGKPMTPEERLRNFQNRLVVYEKELATMVGALRQGPRVHELRSKVNTCKRGIERMEWVIRHEPSNQAV